MMMRRLVNVSQEIVVTVDEIKFTPEFMAEFRSSMYPFHTLEDHIRHLAQLHARGIVGDHSFIEGYGPAKDMGIRFDVAPGSVEAEIVKP